MELVYGMSVFILRQIPMKNSESLTFYSSERINSQQLHAIDVLHYMTFKNI